MKKIELPILIQNSRTSEKTSGILIRKPFCQWKWVPEPGAEARQEGYVCRHMNAQQRKLDCRKRDPGRKRRERETRAPSSHMDPQS